MPCHNSTLSDSNRRRHIEACARRFCANRDRTCAHAISGALASFVFYLVLKGAPADGKWNNFTAASNLYGGTGFSLGAVFLSILFLVVIVSVTTRNCRRDLHR